MVPVVVCHVITRLDVGGAQETATRMCIELLGTRYQPVVVAGADPGYGGSLLPRLRAAGVPVRLLPSLRSLPHPILDIRAVSDLVSVFRSSGAALVHSHSGKAGALARLATRRVPALRSVHMVHGWSFNRFQPVLVQLGIRRLERALARRTDRLLVVTQADAEVGLRHGIGHRAQYRLVRSGVDLDRLQPDAAEVDLLRSLWGSDVIVFVGRLARQKDPLTLIRAFRLVRLALGRGRLVLVGDGPYRQQVEAEARLAGIEDHVELLGIREDVASVLAASDVFALPSRWEGLPRSIIEAMALGVAVVSTAVGGTGEVLEDGVTGLIIPPEDPEALAQALVRLLTDETLRQRLAATARPMARSFSQTAMRQQLLSVYDELCGGRTGG